jgi:hypothetical protein
MFEAPRLAKMIPPSELAVVVRSTERLDAVYNIGNCTHELPIALGKFF